jgi:hypothetical protein
MDVLDELKQELEKRLERPLREYEFTAPAEQIAFVIQYNPPIAGCSVSELAERLVKGDCVQSDLIEKCLPEAAKAAKQDGSPLVTCHESINSRYEVVFGLCVNITPKTIGEVYRAVYAELKQQRFLPDEGFHLWDRKDEDAPFPLNARWIAAYAVTGGSEGHWVHVGAVFQPEGLETETIRHLFFGKTLREGRDGMEFMYRVSAIIANMLA